MDTDFVELRQLQEVGVFSYLVYSLAKSHFNGWVFVKAWMAVFSVSKYLDRVKKNPYSGREQCRDLGFYCSRDFCVIFVLLG